MVPRRLALGGFTIALGAAWYASGDNRASSTSVQSDSAGTTVVESFEAIWNDTNKWSMTDSSEVIFGLIISKRHAIT